MPISPAQATQPNRGCHCKDNKEQPQQQIFRLAFDWFVGSHHHSQQLIDPRISFCLKFPGVQRCRLRLMPATFADFDFQGDRTTRRSNLRGDNFIAVTLQKNTARRSVRYFVHFKDNAMLHFCPKIEERYSSAPELQGLAQILSENWNEPDGGQHCTAICV